MALRFCCRASSGHFAAGLDMSATRPACNHWGALERRDWLPWRSGAQAPFGGGRGAHSPSSPPAFLGPLPHMTEPSKPTGRRWSLCTWPTLGPRLVDRCFVLLPQAPTTAAAKVLCASVGEPRARGLAVPSGAGPGGRAERRAAGRCAPQSLLASPACLRSACRPDGAFAGAMLCCAADGAHIGGTISHPRLLRLCCADC